MARRRGFFAELQYQNQVAEKRRLQAARAAAVANALAERKAEQARKQSERAAVQSARASAAEQKAAEREAKRLHEEARSAEAAARNARLAESYDAIDSILSATLEVDDFVELAQLRALAVHPPFAQTELEVPTPPPVPVSAPPEPSFVEPASPSGLGSLFGGKKKHAEAVSAAQAAFAQEHEAWRDEAAAIPARQLTQMQEHDAAERQRLDRLQQARDEYQRQCDERNAAAAEANRSLDELIAGLQSGNDASIQDYVGIVLSNSVYPEVFHVEHDFQFDSALRELTLTVLVPSPDTLPSDKEHKFAKAKDEIVATPLPKREQQERYASAVHQVALRTLHEIFEADRAAHINTIALTVATEAIDPATGLNKRTSLVAVASERAAFLTFDLHKIVPLATLQHLGASVSKSPFDLAGIDASPGVRGR
jgi:restriction system protein